MLDTIAINLARNEFNILFPERFTPHADAVKNPIFGKGGMVKCYYNPTKTQKEQYYLPRLTLFKKPYGDWSKLVWLKVEFSAPKLVFGNNFEELNVNDEINRVITSLLNALDFMGIETTHHAILNSKVSAIHYSKNILLDCKTPSFFIIQTLEKLDLSAKLDLTQTDFRNGGQMAKYHASSFEIAIYDKVKDLEQARKYGEKRGVENNYGCQLELLDNIKRPEVLRLEVRLRSRKIKAMLKTLNFEKQIILKDLFCANISRAVLLYYWNEITKGLYLLNIEASKAENIVANIKCHFPNKRPSSVMILMSFIQTCQQIGVRGTRHLLNLRNIQFYRMKKDAKILDSNQCSPRFMAISSIKKQLEDFIPVTKEDIVDANLLKTKH